MDVGFRMNQDGVLSLSISEKMEWLARKGRVKVTSCEYFDDDGVRHLLWSVKWVNSYDEDKATRIRYTMESSLQGSLDRAIEGLFLDNSKGE